NPHKILLVIREDLADIKSLYGDKRRSTIVEGELGEVKSEDLISDVPIMMTGYQSGRVSRLLNPGRRSRAEKDLAWYALASNRDDGDALVGAAVGRGSGDYVFVTSDGNAIRFAEDTVRPMGLVAGGVAAIKLAENAEVVGFGLASAGSDLVVVSQSGAGKRTK